MARHLSLLFFPLVLLLLSGGGPQLAPAAASASADPIQGDANCDGAVNAVDSLQVLRSVAGLGTSAGCLADAADVNCDSAIDAIDSLRILRFVAGLSNTPVDGCAGIGDPLAAPSTSEALIADALQSGDITYEESLLYRAYALYDHPDLPAEFRSPVIDYHAAMGLFTDVLEHEGQLSQQLLNDLAPFMARPADPASIFNNPPQATGTAAAAAATSWVSAPAAGGMLRVWVKDGTGAPAALDAYAAEATKVWNKLPGIFRYGLPDTPGAANINPDSAIDIYFADVGVIDPRMTGCQGTSPPPQCAFAGAGGGYTGYTAPFSGNTSASFIMIDSAVTGPMLTSHIAHELMHTGQHAYDLYEAMWLKDATATWGAVRVLEELGVSRQPDFDYLPDFFDGLDKTLTRDTENDLNRYASWLFFFFASMESGDGIVTSIWENAAANGTQNADAVDAVFPFADNFDDFTVRNWNKDPVDPLYRSAPPGDPTFPTNLQPDIPAARDKEFDATGADNVVVPAAPLSALYFRYRFGDGVRRITLQNHVFGNPDAHIWALVKEGGEWQAPEDWSGVEQKLLCRDKPGEDVSEAIIILSNSNLTNNLPGGQKFRLDASEVGCPGYAGWAKATIRRFDDVQDITYTSNKVNLFFEPREVQEVPENVQYDLTVADPVIWTASGTYDGCPVEGQATVVFPGTPYGAGSTAAGYLNVFSLTDNHFLVIVAASPTAVVTVTCPGDPPSQWDVAFDAWYLLQIVSEPNTHEGGETVLKGHQQQPPDLPLPEGLEQTFDWELRPVKGGGGP